MIEEGGGGFLILKGKENERNRKWVGGGSVNRVGCIEGWGVGWGGWVKELPMRKNILEECAIVHGGKVS